MNLSVSTNWRGLLENACEGCRKFDVPGIRKLWIAVVFGLVSTPPGLARRPTGATSLRYPPAYCGWLKTLMNRAENCIFLPSVMLKLLATVKSISSIGGSCPVFRPPLGMVPLGAWMYWALGLLAT